MSASRYLHGVHDPDGAELMAGKPGWIVFTEALGCDPKDTSGVNYSTWTSRGYGVIVRLNNGYYSDNYPGTIPSPDKYDDFAMRCANFVAASDGCEIVIIGNETNMTAETPNRAGIVPSDYARCYRLCRDAIHRIKPQAQVLVAGCAPWNNQSGDWLGYWRSVLSNVGPECDGVAIHTYTHGTDPALITSEEMVHGWHWHFRVYQDQLAVMPAILYGQPVYITETDQDDPWADTNRGWVQEAYAEIDRWNQTSLPSIHALCLFRSLAGDRWSFADKNGVKDDFRAAVAHGYPSPIDDLPDLPELPYPPEFPELPELPMPPELEPETIDWDFRLTKRGCILQPALIPSDIAPLVTIGKWFDPDQAQGRVNVYVRLLDEQGRLMIGVPVTWFWDGGKETKLTERKSDPWLESKGLGAAYSCDFAMYNLAPSYGVRIEGDYHGDIIDGCGLGSIEQPDWKIHTAYFFQWELSSSGITVPPTPIPPPVTARGLLWPVVGPVTQRWGENPDFYQQTLGIPYHNGTDIGVPIGTKVVASDDGIVKWIDDDPQGYGLYCRIYSPAVRFHIVTAHLDSCVVQVGDQVKRGQVIAASGNSGMSSGPHVHIETRAGTEHTYAQGTFGHSNGRCDPQAVYWAYGGTQEPIAGPGR